MNWVAITFFKISLSSQGFLIVVLERKKFEDDSQIANNIIERKRVFIDVVAAKRVHFEYSGGKENTIFPFFDFFADCSCPK